MWSNKIIKIVLINWLIQKDFWQRFFVCHTMWHTTIWSLILFLRSTCILRLLRCHICIVQCSTAMILDSSSRHNEYCTTRTYQIPNQGSNQIDQKILRKILRNLSLVLLFLDINHAAARQPSLPLQKMNESNLGFSAPPKNWIQSKYRQP